ncbi:mitochondrial import inner membrane translocase subunit, putative [Theileria equi strain WA]|uniref:Mitochondrial import inner membrane translocase subunit, putative n=1 Tax=Theileria equi strain WA TaxID=1537102 RepID=L1LEM2_THEEQ|nr:mitochondrial import inner membrane translocase subunit, putative [Theileria equi strain WA]EKX73771.1 mitochondrial import inner membrane translocase subunit, putative [Theileria equi strain WA]|eukprot:XP_004833223.1 mitochondrial import inner membrane translocase subunit, putative [Theileria equi strain WA]
MDDYLSFGSVQPNLEILQQQKIKPQVKSDLIGANLTNRQLYLTGYGRHWGEKITYSVGLAYGSGILCGGSFGLIKGVSKGGATQKLFINSILNNCGKYGPNVGNKAACLTLLYCAFNNAFKFIRNAGDHDVYNAPIAGLVTGAVYKCSGPLMTCAKYSAGTGAVFTAIDYALRNSYI